MILNTNGSTPIYIQIAEWLETEILSGRIEEDERIYSQYQLADMFNINPATAAKGLNILADKGLLYKKRGLGMYITPGAESKIGKERKEGKLRKLIDELVMESQRLGMDEQEVISMLREAKHKYGRDGR